MDRILMDILKKYLLDNGFSEGGITRFMSQYEETCRVWKENTVSCALAENRQVDFCFFISSVFQIMGITPGKFPVISRNSLEHIAGGYLKIYAMLVNGILEEAKKKIKGFTGAEQIDLVILTGGHSQWYFAEGVLTGEVDTEIPVSIGKLKERPERIIRLSRLRRPWREGWSTADRRSWWYRRKRRRKRSRKRTSRRSTAENTLKSGKNVGGTGKGTEGGKAAGMTGKKKENAPAQEARETDADGSEAGSGRCWISKRQSGGSRGLPIFMTKAGLKAYSETAAESITKL